MATLFVPVSTHTRGYAFGLDKSKPHELNNAGITHQGDVGWGSANAIGARPRVG